MHIPIYKPYLPNGILKYAHDALDSGWLSSGKYISIVQERLQDLLGVKHVLLTNNGTSATHLVSKALQYYSGDVCRLEVLVPDNVYVAAWNSMIFDRSFTLKAIPSNIDTWNFDLSKLDKNKDDRNAILVVHNLGNIINVPELQRLYPGALIVEDNCEGFLGKYEGRFSGTACLASSISFFGNKNITSGEGGAFITNNTDLYEYVHCIHGQGQSKTRFIHNHLGYNYRATNIQAAILLGQLEILDEILEKKSAIFDTYRKRFSSINNVRMQKAEDNTEHSNWMFAIRIIGGHGYDCAESYFKSCGIEIRPMFYPITVHKHLSDIYVEDINVSELLNRECIVLPSYPELSQKEQEYIIECVEKYANG